MTPQLHATIMLWSASTDPVRQNLETRANAAYETWSRSPDDQRWKRWSYGHPLDALVDALNDLVNYRHDEALLYEGREVVGIKPECLPDFRDWCARYGFDGGGL